jgi:hypothetical protein
VVQISLLGTYYSVKSYELAYLSLIRPLTEYGAVCWDPYRQNQIDALEHVQRRAAKFVRMGGGPGDDRVNALGWEPLESRRRKARFRALFKAYLGYKAWVDIKR